MAAPTLSELRSWVGGSVAANPDAPSTARLTTALATAVELIEGACQAQYVDPDDDDFVAYPQRIHTAILIRAHAIYLRATSPQGIAGFDDAGSVFRVSSKDPDIGRLVGPFLNADGFA